MRLLHIQGQKSKRPNRIPSPKAARNPRIGLHPGNPPRTNVGRHITPRRLPQLQSEKLISTTDKRREQVGMYPPTPATRRLKLRTRRRSSQKMRQSIRGPKPNPNRISLTKRPRAELSSVRLVISTMPHRICLTGKQPLRLQVVKINSVARMFVVLFLIAIISRATLPMENRQSSGMQPTVQEARLCQLSRR